MYEMVVVMTMSALLLLDYNSFGLYNEFVHLQRTIFNIAGGMVVCRHRSPQNIISSITLFICCLRNSLCMFMFGVVVVFVFISIFSPYIYIGVCLQTDHVCTTSVTIDLFTLSLRRHPTTPPPTAFTYMIFMNCFKKDFIISLSALFYAPSDNGWRQHVWSTILFSKCGIFWILTFCLAIHPSAVFWNSFFCLLLFLSFMAFVVGYFLFFLLHWSRLLIKSHYKQLCSYWNPFEWPKNFSR